MAYSTTTLAQFISYIGSQMGDQGNIYWTPTEIAYAVWEGLRVWGSLTNFWRTRVTLQLKPQAPTFFYDLTQATPAVRTRTYPLWRIVQEIQFMLLEAPSPDGTISGTQMSQQITLDVILNGIQRARNRFVLDAKIPYTVHDDFTTPPAGVGLLTYPPATVYVHKMYWQDTFSKVWFRVKREDAWGIDKTVPTWPLGRDIPRVYSESELSPLEAQLVPIPLNDGKIRALTVDSLVIDITDPNATLNIPDEWIYAIKYGALSYILSADNQMKDDKRAQYAEQRYKQAVEFAGKVSSVIRLMSGGIPLGLDTLAKLDLQEPLWCNYFGAPFVATSLYDLLSFLPGQVNYTVGVTADVVQPAPLPNINDFIQLGQEDMDHLTEYVLHVLKFKCGGADFSSGIPLYDNFMSAVDGRKAVTSARIVYFEPLFGMQSRERAVTPDRMEQVA